MDITSFRSTKKIHFIGIGGIGMSGIAKILHNLGYTVTGSNRSPSENLNELREMNIQAVIGHSEKNLVDAEVVVTSNAISPTNVEVLAARKKKIPVIHRGEMLAELMRLKFGIAVSGTHGKTTTSALVSAVCIGGGLKPSSIIGGRWVGINSNAELGKGPCLICEADESDGSFLKLSPVVSLVTNIDSDHMDYYKTEANLLRHFLEFIHKTPFYGKSILCLDDTRLRHLVPEIQKPFMTYGIEQEAEVRGEGVHYRDGKTYFRVKAFGKDLGSFEIKILGVHNVLNALGAIAVGLELGVETECIKKSLAEFQGVNRRMSILGTYRGFTVMDDYGHHSTEIKATLRALRPRFHRVVAIFQPHRYTRTLEQHEQFAESFDDADEVYLTRIFPSGEEPIPRVSTKLIYQSMKHRPNVYYFEEGDALVEHFKRKHTSGRGVVLTIGAGDVYLLGKKIVGMTS